MKSLCRAALALLVPIAVCAQLPDPMRLSGSGQTARDMQQVLPPLDEDSIPDRPPGRWAKCDGPGNTCDLNAPPSRPERRQLIVDFKSETQRAAFWRNRVMKDGYVEVALPAVFLNELKDSAAVRLRRTGSPPTGDPVCRMRADFNLLGVLREFSGRNEFDYGPIRARLTWWDMDISNGGMSVFKEALFTQIHNAPASITLSVNPEVRDKAIWAASWVVDDRYSYVLKLLTARTANGEPQISTREFKAIAESVSCR